MTCPHCETELTRSFGKWLHNRPRDILANLPYCADGTLPSVNA